MTSFSRWRESRQLTSGRAGSVSQRFASQQLDRYVRNRVRPIAVAAVLILAMSAGIWLLLSSRPGFQGIAAGLMAGVGLTFLYHWCVISSGATSGAMGQAAEEWTDSELRRLHRKGWRHVSHLIIKPEFGDIDHVAVGPDGVIVVETKWRSHEEDIDQLSDWMTGALKQAKRNRQQVVQLLNWQRRDPLLVQSLVVLWGPGVTHDSAEAVLTSEVNVIAGQHLRDELADLHDERLSPEAIDEVYAKLKKRIADRDSWEQANLPPLPVTMQQRADRWARNACWGWFGLFLALFSFKLGWWAFAAIAALAIASFAARRVDEIRPEASAFLGGVLATIPVILIAALWSL